MDEFIGEIKDKFEGFEDVAHGFDHVQRVARLAGYIAEKEECDVVVAKVAAYLHDIGRTVKNENVLHGPAGVEPAKELLERYTDYDEVVKERILNAVRDHSLVHAEGVLTNIVQDADMLDGLGAIGVMRACTYKGYKSYYRGDGDVTIVNEGGSSSATINEMILWWMDCIDLMHTDTAKEIAEHRYNRMKKFLSDLKEEALGLDLKDSHQTLLI